jgi:mRNA interferase MazF
VTFDLWNVVVVPFPFTDRASENRRPALVVSRREFSRGGYTVLAMITSAAHDGSPGDTPIEDLAASGLKAESLVRLKLFTLDNRLILRRIGELAKPDRRAMRANLETFLGWSGKEH